MSDESYDFTDLKQRWREATTAASMCADSGEDEPYAVLGLFLGSVLEEGFEGLANMLETPDALATDDPMEYAHEDKPVRTGPIVLKGRNPVSLLHELCQSKGWGNPIFSVNQTGESHVPTFSGNCQVGPAADDREVTVREAKSKGDLKKKLATKMLLDHFGAQESY